jgi:hypothetical protein
MKRTIIGFIAMVALAAAVGVCGQQEPKRGSGSGMESSGSHLGTWQLASFKYGTNQQSFAEPPSSQRRIKLITETHFTWVEFDPSTKKAQGMAGGAYLLSGDTYTESIDWADSGMESYLGKKHAFTIRVEGDRLFLSGTLADGLKIEEIWQRVK